MATFDNIFSNTKGSVKSQQPSVGSSQSGGKFANIFANQPKQQKKQSKKVSQPKQQILPKKEPTFLEKTTNTFNNVLNALKNIDAKRIKTAITSGLKSTPGTLKIATGVIAEGWATQQKFMNDFYQKAPLFAPPGAQLEQTITKPLVEKTKTEAPKLRTTGEKERQKALVPYQKLGPASGKIQQIAEALAFNLPQMALSTGLTVGTAIVTKNPVLATSVGLGTSYGLGASETYSDARTNGLTDKQALPYAMIGGALIGALDFVPLGRLIKKTGGEEVIKHTIVKKIAREIVSIGTQSGFEGITEGAQQLVGNAIQSVYSDKKDYFSGVALSAVVGALFGGISDVSLQATLWGSSKITNRQGIETVNKKIEEALKTPANARTPEQQQIVEQVLTTQLSPDEAIGILTRQNFTKTTEGKNIMKQVIQAKEQNKEIQITTNEQKKIIDVTIVDPKEQQQIFTLEKNIDEYRRFGGYSVGTQTPDASLIDIGRIANRPDIIKYTQQKVQEAIRKGEIQTTDDGKIVLYRGGNPSKQNNLVSYSYDKAVAQRFVTTAKEKGKTIPLTQLAVSPEDIKVFIGKAEKEVLLEKQTIKSLETAQNALQQTKQEKTVKETQKGKKAPSQAVKQVVPSKESPVGTAKTKNSRLFERVKQYIGDEYASAEIKYNTLDLEKQATAVVTLLETNPEQAVRIAKGFEEPPAGMTQNAVALAVGEQALSQKDYQTAADVYTKASLRSTRLGQEIVSLRGNVGIDTPYHAIREVIRQRVVSVGKKYKRTLAALNLPADTPTLKKIDVYVKQEARKVRKQITRAQKQIQSAQSIIDALKCK